MNYRVAQKENSYKTVCWSGSHCNQPHIPSSVWHVVEGVEIEAGGGGGGR
jgi:hypothetical protein